MPDRPNRQVGRLRPELVPSVGLLDVGTPALALGTVGDVGAQNVTTLDSLRPIGPCAILADDQAQSRSALLTRARGTCRKEQAPLEWRQQDRA